MKLKLLNAHQDDAYPEIGTVSLVSWNIDRTIFALASEYAPLPSPIRPRFMSKHGQRLSLYFADGRKFIACLSGMSHEVFHIAFHPERPLLLISTASYDGGFYFEGELIEWNWEKNESKHLAEGPAFYAFR